MIISKKWKAPASLNIIESTNNGYSYIHFQCLLSCVEYIIRYVTGITLVTEIEVDIAQDNGLLMEGITYSANLWTIKRQRKQNTSIDSKTNELKHEEFDCFIITFSGKEKEVDWNGTVTAILMDANTNKPTTIEKVL